MDVTQSEPLPLLLAPYSKVEHRNNYHPDHQHYRGRLIIRSLNLNLNQIIFVRNLLETRNLKFIFTFKLKEMVVHQFY